MHDSIQMAREALRAALARCTDPVAVSLEVPRPLAEKLLRLLEAEDSAGAVVVPIREFYTTTESASMLGISRATLMKLIESGELEAIKVGTHHRIPGEELLAYQRARQVSRAKATAILNEISDSNVPFQSNVTFGATRSSTTPTPAEGIEP